MTFDMSICVARCSRWLEERLSMARWRWPSQARLSLGSGAAPVVCSAPMFGFACKRRTLRRIQILSVVCGSLERDDDDADAIVNPALLVEVLSDSTEAYDRGEKAAHYRKIPSLKEYVLVAQHQPRVEVFRRNESGWWEFYEFGPDSEVQLASVGCSVNVAELYRDPLTG